MPLFIIEGRVSMGIRQIAQKALLFITDFKGCAGRMEYGISCLLILIVLPVFILLAGGANDTVNEIIQHIHEVFSSSEGFLFNILAVLFILSSIPIFSFIVILFLFPLLGVEMGVLLNPHITHELRLPLLFLFAVMGIPVLISYIAVTVRRLHDIRQPGWPFLLTWIPVINLFIFFNLLFKKTKSFPYKRKST